MVMNTIKLAKYLAQGGVASRRKCEAYIKQGRVKVNGLVNKNVATRINPHKDKVEYQNQVVNPVSEMVLLKMYKPVGVVSTVDDPQGRPTVLDLLPSEFKKYRLYPVGRLDVDSEGLILLTNDGDLAQQLTHPSYEVLRTYEVTISGALSSAELYRLKTGVPLKDGRTLPAQAEVLDNSGGKQIIEITLREGRNHQIRRMMQALNHEVLKLVRTSHGEYSIGDLQPGEYLVEKVTSVLKN